VIGATATESGTALMPMKLGMVFSSIAAGQLISRTGRYRPAALTGLGLTLVSIFLLSRLSTTASYGEVVFDMILMGLGLGTCMPVFTLVVQNAVPYAQLGVATSMSQFARSIGGTLGAAAFGSLLVNRYEPAFRAALTDELLTTLPAEQLARFDNPQSLLNPLEAGQLRETFAQYGPQGPMLLEQLREAIRVGLASAIQEMFLVGTFVVLLAFVTALFLKEIPLRRSHAGAAPASERPSASNGAAGGPPTVTASEPRVQPVRGGGRPAVERPSAEASGRH
jgi:MFS family permease